jgi:AraC-like DNA-binding protein
MPYVLYAASACIALCTLFFALLPDRKSIHFFVVVAFSCLSYILFYFAGDQSGLLSRVPILLHTDISVTFIAAPAIYFSFVSLMREGRPLDRAFWPHFVIPGAVTFFFPIANLCLPPLESVRFFGDGPFAFSMFSLFNFLCDLSFTFYFALALGEARRLRARGEVTMAREFRVMVIFIALLLANSLFLLSGHILRSPLLFNVATVGYSVIVIGFTAASIRIPDYVLVRFRRQSPESALLSRDEVALVRDRLDVLMSKKRLYTNPDLSLKALAVAVSVTPHELSWFINNELKVGFAEYVNGFRLEGVKRDLLARPEAPILEIALDNGFGSKTMFNSLFRENVGESPREWRRRNGSGR